MISAPIVAATDGSGQSLRAIEWAAMEAALRGTPLRILSVAALRHDRDQALYAAAALAIEIAPDVVIDTGDLTGQPAQAVAGSGSGALMLVVGSHAVSEFTAMVLGSVSRYAASHAPCPVVVIHDESPSRRHLVGVGLGDLDNCASALSFAFEEASLRNADLTAVHAWRAPRPGISRAGEPRTAPSLRQAETEASARLRELLGSWQESYPQVPVHADVVHGHPARALVGLSAQADLVVIGRHARRSAPRGSGAVRFAVLNHAHGPIVTVPDVQSRVGPDGTCQAIPA